MKDGQGGRIFATSLAIISALGLSLSRDGRRPPIQIDSQSGTPVPSRTINPDPVPTPPEFSRDRS